MTEHQDLHAHYHLLPSYTEEERKWKLEKIWEKNEKLREIIENLNRIIWWTHWMVTELVWTEVEKIWIIHDLFANFTEKTWKFFSNISEKKEWNIWYKNFVQVVNLFFSALRVKKFYNTIPKESFTEFSSTELNDQIVKITLPLDTDNHFYSKTTWWSCHNWSILFHDYFDKIWIESEIVLLNPISNHSFTKVKIWEKYFVMDPLYKMWKEPLFEIKVWSKVRIWSDEFWIIKDLEDFKFDVTEDFEGSWVVKRNVSPKFFTENKNFTEVLDNRKIDYIICWYNIAETRELFEVNFEHFRWNKIVFNFEKWDWKWKFQITQDSIRKRFKWQDVENLTNNEILKKIVKIVKKDQQFEKAWVFENLETISEKLNRNQFLKFLGLN